MEAQAAELVSHGALTQGVGSPAAGFGEISVERDRLALGLQVEHAGGVWAEFAADASLEQPDSNSRSHSVDKTHWLRGRRGTRSQIPPSRNKRATRAPRRSRPSAKRAPPAGSSDVFDRCRREWDRGFESGFLRR